jgi:hypothetical protein
MLLLLLLLRKYQHSQLWAQAQMQNNIPTVVSLVTSKRSSREPLVDALFQS